jgi:predicted nucleic acid-binding protein
LKVVDTSVVVAGFASWHEAHEPAREALDAARMTAHGALETYSVLTRLPSPHRAPSGIVTAFLVARFPQPWLELPGQEHRRLLETLTTIGVRGGSTYDALIGWTASHHGASLLTLDARATPTYEALGVSFELIT